MQRTRALWPALMSFLPPCSPCPCLLSHLHLAEEAGTDILNPATVYLQCDTVSGRAVHTGSCMCSRQKDVVLLFIGSAVQAVASLTQCRPGAPTKRDHRGCGAASLLSGESATPDQGAERHGTSGTRGLRSSRHSWACPWAWVRVSCRTLWLNAR